MQDHPKGAGEAPSIITWDEDDREQAAVLRLVLELHPDALTRDELVREMTGGGSRDFSERWGETLTGEPMPNAAAAVRRPRESH